MMLKKKKKVTGKAHSSFYHYVENCFGRFWFALKNHFKPSLIAKPSRKQPLAENTCLGKNIKVHPV